jgi:membrane protease YdiL (CAAX protease family)
LPLVVGTGLVQLLPAPPAVASHDFAALVGSDAGRAFFKGNWTWFGIVVVMALFNTVLGEELLFRGFLLPRMRTAFGRNDWVINGALFALYHLHQPWSMPSALFDTVLLAWPTRRWRSAWFGIVVHSTQSVLFVGLTLALVLTG